MTQNVFGHVVDLDDETRADLLEATDCEDLAEAIDIAIDAAAELGNAREVAECYNGGGEP